jgi:hypothetical protein
MESIYSSPTVPGSENVPLADVVAVATGAAGTPQGFALAFCDAAHAGLPGR